MKPHTNIFLKRFVLRYWFHPYIADLEPNKLHSCLQMAQYSWDNRIKFLVCYLYDLDNNGYMNKNDFDCLAVKFTVMEGRGQWNDKRLVGATKAKH